MTPPRVRIAVENPDGTTSKDYTLTKAQWEAMGSEERDQMAFEIMVSVGIAMETVHP